MNWSALIGAPRDNVLERLLLHHCSIILSEVAKRSRNQIDAYILRTIDLKDPRDDRVGIHGHLYRQEYLLLWVQDGPLLARWIRENPAPANSDLRHFTSRDVVSEYGAGYLGNTPLSGKDEHTELAIYASRRDLRAFPLR